MRTLRIHVNAFILLFLLAPASTAGEVMGWWALDGKEGTSAEGMQIQPTGTGAANGGTVAYDTNAPGRFIYDPLTRKSRKNETSLRVKDGGHIKVPFDPAGITSFTIEAFVQFDQDPQRSVGVVMKTRTGETGSEIITGTRYLSRWKQTYFGTLYTPSGGKQKELSVGSYTSKGRLRNPQKGKSEGNLGWRHIAFVYDAEAKSVHYYMDGYLHGRQSVEKPLTLDAGPVLIGGTDKHSLDGYVDEVRIIKAALKPYQFLRARDDAIENVSFKSENTVLPPDCGHYNLKEHFGAAGDGKTDDTKAIQQAFSELSNHIPLGYNTLYVPPGTYLVSDTLWHSRFFVVQGAGSDKTIIKLKDNAKGFDNPKNPKPVIRASSTSGPPGSNKRCNGSSIGLYEFGYAIDTGKGNPGATGIEYHSNNHGGMDDVVIRSGDGSGVVGLDLTHNCAGPSLIKNVSIHGFDIGVAINRQEYSLTMEHIRLEKQNKAGIQVKANIVGIRKLHSINRVPAILAEGGNSMVTLLDSRLEGGSPETIAIQSEGALYARNIEVDGYGTSLKKRIYEWHGHKKKPKFTWKDGPVLTGNIKEFIGDKVVSPHGNATGALNLPIEETPDVPWGDLEKDWVNVSAFESSKQGPDWGLAIQAAIDSGAKTIYFPWQQNGYEIHTPVRLHGKVERLFGMRTELSGKKDSTDPVLIFDDPDASKTVVIERLDIKSLRHESPATLVLKHSTPSQYSNKPDCGKLFMEDVMATGYVFDRQKVWVRQWNPESHAAGPCILSKGATIWALGFKTEYESSKLWAQDGARTEIYASFIYPIGKIPKDRPIFKNTDSWMSLQYGTSVYAANHQVHIIDTQNGDTKTIGNDAMTWAGSRARMDLFVSTPE